MKDEGAAVRRLPHPSSYCFHPSSFILHPLIRLRVPRGVEVGFDRAVDFVVHEDVDAVEGAGQLVGRADGERAAVKLYKLDERDAQQRQLADDLLQLVALPPALAAVLAPLTEQERLGACVGEGVVQLLDYLRDVVNELEVGESLVRADAAVGRDLFRPGADDGLPSVLEQAADVVLHYWGNTSVIASGMAGAFGIGRRRLHGGLIRAGV